MKRFTVTVLSVSVFFLGLGALVEKVGARFKSDEKALELIAQARKAIGGDDAIKGVQSLRIVGKTTRATNMDGFNAGEPAETEIALQFPDKFMKMTNTGKSDGKGMMVESNMLKRVDVVVTGDDKDHMKVMVDGDGHGDGASVARKIVIKKDDGTVQELTGDEAAAFLAKNHPGGAAHTIILKKNADGTIERTGGEDAHVILRKVDGGNVTFETKDDKAGDSGAKNVIIERKVDGEDGHVFLRKSDGGTATFTSNDGKTFVISDKDTGMARTMGGGGAMTMVHDGAMRQNDFLRTTLGLLLTAPQGMDVSYTYSGESDVDGTSCNVVVAAFGGASYKLFLSKASSLPVMMSYNAAKAPQVFMFRTKAPVGTENTNDVKTFNRTIDDGRGASAEFSVKFSDYRTVNGVQLPYKWTQTVGGTADETFDVSNYEVNPTNIADKFQNQHVMVRTTKPIDK